MRSHHIPCHGTSHVWNQTPRYDDLLDPTQVSFINDYPSKDDNLGLMACLFGTQSKTTAATTSRRCC
jgi:hypothetical protein